MDTDEKLLWDWYENREAGWCSIFLIFCSSFFKEKFHFDFNSFHVCEICFLRFSSNKNFNQKFRIFYVLFGNLDIDDLVKFEREYYFTKIVLSFNILNKLQE